MTCPICKSQRVSCPTKRMGSGPGFIKTGPATCLNCGAHEVKDGNTTKWVGGNANDKA